MKVETPPKGITTMAEDSEIHVLDSPIYRPPADPERTDELDASIDGTSAAQYGANDPALYENTDPAQD